MQEAHHHLHEQAIQFMGDITTHIYDRVFFFETWTFGKEDALTKWMQENWSISIVVALAYCILVFVGRKVMQKREALNLKWPLVCWSGLLAIFSIVGTIRTWPEAFRTITEHGVRVSLCHPSYYYHVTGFWCFLFTTSKVLELGDTLFIVARKQRLIFLHWYHHATVLMYAFYSYADHTAPGRWFYCMNFLVHSFMYSYYTARALRLAVPRFVSVFITALQIVQMLIGNAIFIYLAAERLPHLLGLVSTPPPFCHVSNANIFFGGLMYLSYLVLFVNFFVNSYLSTKSVSSETNGATAHKRRHQVTDKYE